MSHVQQKRGGHVARWTNPDGREKTTKVLPTKKEARDYLATEVDPKLAKGIGFDPARGKIRFREVAGEWLDSRPDLKETTRAAYREALAATAEGTAKRHNRLADLRIDSVFGGYPVNRIRREDVQKWVQRMIDAGKKPSTVRNAYFIVRQVLGHAVVDGRIDTNPADYVKLPTEHNSGSQRTVDDPEQFLTAAQVAALVDATPWPYNVLVHTAAWAGLRAGELAGLQVGDVTLPPPSLNPNAPVRPGSLRIDRTVVRVGSDLTYLTPKTKGSRRRVPLTPQTTELLRDYLAMHPRADDPEAPLFPAFRLDTPKPSTSTAPAAPAKVRADRQADALAALTVDEAERRLVLDWDAPLRHATFYKAVFHPAVLRAIRIGPAAKISPALKFHALRHTYASLCVAAGIPMFELSRFMGHAKPSTTETVYAHLLSDDHSEAMSALGGMATTGAVSNVIRLRRSASST